MNTIMEEFKKYALEQYGYSISFKESETPDTFESLFGASFLYSVDDSWYSTDIPSVEFKVAESSSLEEYDLQQNIVLAA